MILSDKRILEEIERGTIKIAPYNRDCLGSNSYDVHLGANLATYEDDELDAKNTILYAILKYRMKGWFCSLINFI